MPSFKKISQRVSELSRGCSLYSKGFRVTDLNSRVDARVVANVDGRTDGRTYGRTYGRKTGSIYRTMPEAGATKMKNIKQRFILFICLCGVFMVSQQCLVGPFLKLCT